MITQPLSYPISGPTSVHKAAPLTSEVTKTIVLGSLVLLGEAFTDTAPLVSTTLATLGMLNSFAEDTVDMEDGTALRQRALDTCRTP